MKSCFTALIVALLSFAAYAGDVPQSVLQPTPADAPVAAAAPVAAPVVVSEPVAVCTNGRCARLYNVETECSESCRNRLFGGHVVRKTSRTVYRPSRR